MNLYERGAGKAAPIIAGDEQLRSLHSQLMTEGNKQDAAHLVDVITVASELANEAEGNLPDLTAESLVSGHEPTTIYAYDNVIY